MHAPFDHHIGYWGAQSSPIDFGDVPTWIAAIAALLTLIGATAAVLISISALGVERERDRRALVREERAQASAVDGWESTRDAFENTHLDGSAPIYGVALSNASALPVRNLRVTWYGPERLDFRASVTLPSVIPGTTWVQRPDDFRIFEQSEHGRFPTESYNGFPFALEFTDAEGRAWLRDVNGILSRHPNATGRPAE